MQRLIKRKSCSRVHTKNKSNNDINDRHIWAAKQEGINVAGTLCSSWNRWVLEQWPCFYNKKILASFWCKKLLGFLNQGLETALTNIITLTESFHSAFSRLSRQNLPGASFYSLYWWQFSVFPFDLMCILLISVYLALPWSDGKEDQSFIHLET